MDNGKNQVGSGFKWMEAIAAETIMATKIAQAKDIQERIDTLIAEQDRILDPLIQHAIMEDNPNKTMRLVRTLPTGFHRTELRTHHITRMEDYEYRRRFIGSAEDKS